MKFYSFLEKLQEKQEDMGSVYFIIFKVVLPFFAMIIPIDQIIGVIFGSQTLHFIIPIEQTILELGENPFYIGTNTLVIICVAFFAFGIMLIFLPKVASVIEFVVFPCYIFLLYSVFFWSFNVWGIVSLVGISLLILFKLLTFVKDILINHYRKIYSDNVGQENFKDYDLWKM
jgi:hypothetical protein